MKKLPVKLLKEPLIDVVFEVRFKSTIPVSNILPGIFLGKLSNAEFERRLPIADIPSVIRDADNHLKYAPYIRMTWDDYFILIGDRTLGVACKLPYKGWTEYKPSILEVFRIFSAVSHIEYIERYSMKYVDMITYDGSYISLLNLNVKVGQHQLESESFHLRVDIPKEGVLAVVQLAAPAEIILPGGEKKTGLVTDIDCIKTLQESNQDFFEKLSDRLDRIHDVNKKTFFECLSPKAIELLEPIYD